MSRKQKIIQKAINSNVIDHNLTSIGIMDFEELKKTIIAASEAFPDNFFHTFALKANPLVKVLQHICKNGMGAEVASPGELAIALAAGFSTDAIIFDSPTKTIADLRTCIENGISINIDNLQELARIDILMKEFPDTTSFIGFRINPQIGSGKISSTSTSTATSKFGFALKDGDNRQQLIDLYKERPWLKSIHTHTGSQGCSLELISTGVQAITDLAEEINASIGKQQVVRLDIGGGLPVNFHSDEISPTFKEFASILEANIPVLFSDKYQIKTEFGRAIVAKNGFIVTRVEYTKSSGGRHIAATHCGAQIITRTAFLPESWPLRVTGYSADGSELYANITSTDIAGPCCFAADLICSNRQLPKLSPDDYVLVHDTGGYYFSNHFDYNSIPKIAVYAVSGDDVHLQLNIIRNADTLEEVLSKM